MNREHIVIARRYDEMAIKANPDLAAEFVKGHYVNGDWLMLSDEMLEERDKYSESYLRKMKKSDLIDLALKYQWNASGGNLTKDIIIKHIFGSSASGLRTLIAGTINYASEADYTISYRSMKEIVARGDPSQLNVPYGHANSCMELYLPLFDNNDPKKTWAHACYYPNHSRPYLVRNTNGYHLYKPTGPDRWLLSKNIGRDHRGNLSVLIIHLKNTMTDWAIKEMEARHNHREIWVRHDWTARDLFPNEFKGDKDVIVNLADHNKMEMDNGEKTGR